MPSVFITDGLGLGFSGAMVEDEMESVDGVPEVWGVYGVGVEAGEGECTVAPKDAVTCGEGVGEDDGGEGLDCTYSEGVERSRCPDLVNAVTL